MEDRQRLSVWIMDVLKVIIWNWHQGKRCVLTTTTLLSGEHSANRIQCERAKRLQQHHLHAYSSWWTCHSWYCVTQRGDLSCLLSSPLFPSPLLPSLTPLLLSLHGFLSPFTHLLSLYPTFFSFPFLRLSPLNTTQLSPISDGQRAQYVLDVLSSNLS